MQNKGILGDENIEVEEDGTICGGNPLDTVPDLASYDMGLEWEDFVKNTLESRIWWTGAIGYYGGGWFSFDRKKLYSVFGDARNLTGEERKIFIEDCPYWANFFNMKE